MYRLRSLYVIKNTGDKYCNMKWVLTKLLVVLMVASLMLVFPKTALGQVIINEFLPKSSQEWVEFYNEGSSTEDLSNYSFDDDADFSSDSGSSDKFRLQGFLPSYSTCYWKFNGYLNDDGDTPTLFYLDGTVVDSYSYTGAIQDKSYSRVPDGGDWQANQDPTQSLVECSSLSLSPTPTKTFVPTTLPFSPTPTLTPTPVQKAIYKINKAKDENGRELSRVKIYIDDQYTGHVDEQVLTFCDSCHCDGNRLVDCGFGEHDIRLEKEEYEDWQETRTFNAGDFYEVNPVMAKIPPSPTPVPTITPTLTLTPTPTLKPSLTPTKTPTPSVFLTPTPTGEVLGKATASESGLLDLAAEEATPIAGQTFVVSGKSEDLKKIIFSALLAILGTGFISFSIFSFLKSRKQQKEAVA